MCQGKLLHLELESPIHSHRKCLRKGHYSSVFSMVQTHTSVNAATAVFLRHAFQHLAAQPASPCFRNQCWVSDGKRVRNRTSPVTQVPLPPPKMPRASGKMTYSFDFWFTNSFSTTLKTRNLQQDTGMLYHFTWTDADVTDQQQLTQSLGFSRQEHRSGLPFPSPMHESEKWKWSHSVVSNS